MMDEYDELLAAARITFQSNGEWSKTCDDLAAFRTLVERSDSARKVLVELIYHEDGSVRILAAEALAHVKSEPKHAIPVLTTLLDAVREMGYPPEREMYARLALGALGYYGEEAVAAEKAVWPYLHCQKDLNLQMYAAQVVINIAVISSASWTVMSLLCNHEDEALRTFCRDRVRERYSTPSPETHEETSGEERFELIVNGKELKQALREITRFKKKGMGELMMVSFEDGTIRFSMGNVSVGASATGTWPTDVLAPAVSIYGLARFPIKEDSVRVVLMDDRLKIGSTFVHVEWGGKSSV